MKNKITAVFLAAFLLLGSFCTCITVSAEADDYGYTGLQSEFTYAAYAKEHETKSAGAEEIRINAADYDKEKSAKSLEEHEDYEGCGEPSVLFPEKGGALFYVNIPSDGKYLLKLEYFTGTQSGSAAVRDILIDGKLPFFESSEIVFYEHWEDKNGKEIVFDKNGNQIRSKQVQKKERAEIIAADSSGQYNEDFEYFLTQGEHTITLEAKRETLHLLSITLYPKPEVRTYKQLLEAYKGNGYKEVSKEANVTIEAENTKAKSDQTLYPLSDRSTPSVSPYHVSNTRYNTIGGTQWQMSGQWIEWEVTVSQSGLYKIASHFKQSFKVNDLCVRALYINGKLPFAEASNLRFYYDGAWQTGAFSGEDNEPYLFYFEKGRSYTVRLAVTLGEITQSLRTAFDCLYRLNEVYRELVVITGSTPDMYRDYQLDKTVPETIKKFKGISADLKALEKEVTASNKEGGQSTAAIKRLYLQMDKMTEDSDLIPKMFSSFKDNISSFGTWINDRTRQPVEIDTLMFLSPGSPLPKGEANILRLAGHYLAQFFHSFFTVYDTVGTLADGKEETITVWTASGRDQAQILNRMIADDFTEGQKVSVDLQLVTPSALLPSIIAGTAPDIYMGMLQSEPINMALRSALADLSSFEDYQTISERFHKESLVPFDLDGRIYALPDTLDYTMLFYRKDILKQMGIHISQLERWDTILKNVLPDLQINSLSFGLNANGMSYLTFLYQSGGEMYKNGGRSSAISSTAAIGAMTAYSRLYTQYGLPLSYDFANRFRSGEMPIAVDQFTLYNQLVVFAPEIKGLWGMLPVPGTLKPDGTVDHTTASSTTGSVILSTSKKQKHAWEFLKWWSSKDVQKEYGTSLESVIGAAARYNSANIEALSSVQWDYDIKESLQEQIKSIKAYHEVPGGYIMTRYFDFAFRDIVLEGKGVRETLTQTVAQVDREITHKRKEYGLDQ